MDTATIIRALIMECNTPAQKVRRLLKEAGLKAKVTTGQMSQLTDSGWRGGPKTASASVLVSAVSPEAQALLDAVHSASVGIRVEFSGHGAPHTHQYVISS